MRVLMPWTPENVARCTELFLAGHSCAVVAQIISGETGFKFTRNAVIGKIHRLGIDRPGASKPTMVMRYGEAAAIPGLASYRPRSHKAKTTRVYVPKVPKPPKVQKAAPAPILVPVSANMVRIEGLTSKTCKFAVAGEGADTLFCGDPPEANRCYCPGHSRIAYLPQTVRKERNRLSDYLARKYA